jgi:hypothetical protein
MRFFATLVPLAASLVLSTAAAGIALGARVRELMSGRRTARLTPAAVLLLALLPVAPNWKSASRRHGPDARLAADFAYDLLNTAPRSAGDMLEFGGGAAQARVASSVVPLECCRSQRHRLPSALTGEPRLTFSCSTP